jgi:hypothetical protein
LRVTLIPSPPAVADVARGAQTATRISRFRTKKKTHLPELPLAVGFSSAELRPDT